MGAKAPPYPATKNARNHDILMPGFTLFEPHPTRIIDVAVSRKREAFFVFDGKKHRARLMEATRQAKGRFFTVGQCLFASNHEKRPTGHLNQSEHESDVERRQQSFGASALKKNPAFAEFIICISCDLI
jgi:hypothetical protein